jgi:hypothetical protein
MQEKEQGAAHYATINAYICCEQNEIISIEKYCGFVNEVLIFPYE